MQAADILSKAKAIHAADAANHRDKMLDVGRLLSRYIVAFCDEGGCRAQAIKKMTREMHVSAEYVQQLICAAKAVDLLGGDNLGHLAHGAIRCFRVFLRRVGDRHGQNASETWDLKPDYEAKAKSLFERTVASQWTERETLREVQKVFRPKPKSLAGGSSRPVYDNDDSPAANPVNTANQFRESMKKASAGDVAETCIKLVEAAEDPAAVAVRLRVLLERFLPKKVAIAR